MSDDAPAPGSLQALMLAKLDDAVGGCIDREFALFAASLQSDRLAKGAERFATGMRNVREAYAAARAAIIAATTTQPAKE